MDKHFEDLEAALSPEGFIQAVKLTTTWANGNLMSVSRTRLNNHKLHNDPDWQDTPISEQSDEDKKNDHTEEVGYARQLTPTQRGDCFASIRTTCMKIAEERNWTGFDKPADFKTYIESLITGKRKSVATKEQIEEELASSLGMTEDEVKDEMIDSFKIQAAMLEDQKEDLVSTDSDYTDDIPFEEAMNVLGLLQRQRILVKYVDGFVYEFERLRKTLKLYPGMMDLRTKSYCLMQDAVKLDDMLDAFELKYTNQLDTLLAGTGRVLPQPTRPHLNRLWLARQQLENPKRKQA